MNKQETIQIITLLAGNYNSIAEKDKLQKQLMVNTWLDCLCDLDYEVVLKAVKLCMINSPYPPMIHDIRKYASEILYPASQRSAMEAWEEAYCMICNGLYMTEEEYQKHSEDVKHFFGSVSQVRELSQSKIDTVHTVVKGQFLKQYEIFIQRKKEKQLLPTNLQKMIQKASNVLAVSD